MTEPLDRSQLSELVQELGQGNVRELVNLCRRLSVLAPGSEVHAEDLPGEVAGASTAGAAEAWTASLALTRKKLR